MPTIGLEAGVVLLMLLPGFVSAKMIQTFSHKTHRTEFEKVTDALIHTFIIAVLYSLFIRQLPIHVNTWADNNKLHYDVEVFRGRLVVLLSIAFGWGVLLMVCKNLDLPWKWLRKLGASQGSARLSVWHDAFYEHKGQGYVQVELRNGRHVMGYVQHYSQDPYECSLFIEDAAWVRRRRDGTNAVVKIPGPGILLTKESEIMNVIFLDAGSKSEQARSATTAQS